MQTQFTDALCRLCVCVCLFSMSSHLLCRAVHFLFLVRHCRCKTFTQILDLFLSTTFCYDCYYYYFGCNKTHKNIKKWHFRWLMTKATIQNRNRKKNTNLECIQSQYVSMQKCIRTDDCVSRGRRLLLWFSRKSISLVICEWYERTYEFVIIVICELFFFSICWQYSMRLRISSHSTNNRRLSETGTLFCFLQIELCSVFRFFFVILFEASSCAGISTKCTPQIEIQSIWTCNRLRARLHWLDSSHEYVLKGM